MCKLNAKQKRFCREFAVDLNATEAAKRAGYSQKTAYSQGHRLLKHAEIQKELSKIQARIADKLDVSAERVVAELARIAFSDMRDVATWGPGGVALKDCGTLTENQARAVAEVSQTEFKGIVKTKIKLYDKVKALENLAKHLGLLTEKIEHSGTISAGFNVVFEGPPPGDDDAGDR